MAKSEIRSGAVLSYLSIFIGSSISIVYTPFMLRLLGPGEYGLMSLANSVVGYLSILNMGLGSAMVRYLSKYRANEDTDMVNALMTLFLTLFSAIAFLIFICGIILSYNVDSIFGKSLSDSELVKLRILIIIMSLNLAVSMCSGVFYAVLMAYEKFVFTKVAGIINTIVTPMIMLPLLYIGYKAVGLVVASSILNIINLIIIVYYIFKYLNLKLLHKKFDKDFIKELFGFSFFVFFALIIDKVYWGTDQFILGSVAGTTSVAIYNVGANFMTYFMSFSTAISGLFLPRLTSMNEQGAKAIEFSNLFIKVGRVQFLILSFILGGFILLGQQFIIMWAGADYTQSYIIAITLIIPFIVPLIQNLGLQILYARNKHKFRSILLFVIAIINVIVSIPAAQKYGGLGCATVTAISFVIGQILILNWYYYKSINLDIPRFWRNILKLSIPFITMLAIGWLLLNYIPCDSWAKLVIAAVIYTITYFPMMYVFGMDEYERHMTQSYLKKLLPYRRHKV